jgi:hypothetical protein
MKKLVLIIVVALSLIGCSKEKQRKTYEFEGRLYQSAGIGSNRTVNGKLRMDGTGYGEISFDGVSAIQVQAVSTPKDNHINFMPQAKYNRGGHIKKNGEVYFKNDVMYFTGTLIK